MSEIQPTESFSFSKLETYENCGFKFKLKYRDKLNFFTQNVATELGTCVHSIEEDIANAIKAGEKINYVQLKNRLILKMYELEHKYPEAYKELDKSDRTYKEKIYNYLESGIYRLEKYLKDHPTYKVVATEQHFKVEVDGVGLNGYIDRILQDTATGEFIVQDIKTYAIPVEDQKLVTPLQFVVYVLALTKLYNVKLDKIKCSYDLPFCDIVQAAGTKGFMTRGLKKLHKLVDAINNNEFVPKPSPLCHWCEFCPTNPNQPKETKGKCYCPYHSLWTRQNQSFEAAEVWQGLEQHGIVLENYIKKHQLTTV